MIRLLFIDDDPQAQKTLKMVLDGYHVISSYTGKQGLRLIREEDPDVVLLDINLPDEDGIKVLEKIADIPMPPPVIIVTASQIRYETLFTLLYAFDPVEIYC